MTIKRYVAYKDNTLTNAYETNLTTRGTGSNMGLADSLEMFAIYAQANSSSNEQSRILLQFPVTTDDSGSFIAGTAIIDDRKADNIPESGSVNFYLRLFNVVHDQTVPSDFTLIVSPVSQSWEEGYGLDMENYSDLTYNGTGSNWMSASATSGWVNDEDTALTGGSYLSASWMGSNSTRYNEFNYKKTVSNGISDLEIDITGLVEQWILGTSTTGYNNYGIGVHLTSSQASGSRSYYTKKFSARNSEYIMKRPIIEARWDNSKKDKRGDFYISSSALSSANNLNILYLYNYVRGQPTDLADVTGSRLLSVNIYVSASADQQLTTTTEMPVTGGWVSTGVYSASFALATSSSVVYDIWWSGSDDSAISNSGVRVFHTGSFKPKTFQSSNIYSIPRYITTITNLNSEYRSNDTTRLRLFTRLKDWSPTIYTKASKEIENDFIDDAYWKLYREIDEFEVVAYGTGSTKHTRLSYDVTGSYFDLDMKMLEANYSYVIKFAYYVNGQYQEQPEIFKFRVIE